MKNNLFACMAFFMAVFLVVDANAQLTTEQNSSFMSGETSYTAKPKNAWELGLHIGRIGITGDIEQHQFASGFGGGIHVRKGISYLLSWRADLMYGSTRGYDLYSVSPSVLKSEQFYQTSTEGRQSVDDYGNTEIFRNYKNETLSGSFSLVFNIGNILFHSSEPKWGLYAYGGIGFYTPDVGLNLRDDNGQVYDFDQIDVSRNTKNIRNDIKDLLDSDYEVEAGKGIDDKSTYFSGVGGLGISRKLGKRVSMSLEHQMTFSNNDLLDGYEYRTATDKSNNNDIYGYTSLRFNFALGNYSKRSEPLYWVNPINTPYNDIASLKRRPVLDLTDSDGDGVVDMMDAEVDSPEGALVDTRGVAIDSDHDGILDYKDKEPFSPPGYSVDANGVAQVPDPGYVTESDVNTIVNNKISQLPKASNEIKWYLPMIHFDLDKYFIKSDFYPELHQISVVLKQNPSERVVVRGYTDNSASEQYNNVLSYNRAKAAIDYLIGRYGIDRSRLILQYGGEMQPLVDAQRTQKEKYINRRVEFRIAEPGDQEMGRPSGPEAGQGASGGSYSGNKNSGY